MGHAVQHIAQHPEARHPRAERQAVRQLRRAVYQCGDEPNDDEIRNKRAGDAQQRRKDAQKRTRRTSLLPALPATRRRNAFGSISFMVNSFRLHYAARCFFTIRLPIIAPIKAATITPATSATDTQDCSIWDAAKDGVLTAIGDHLIRHSLGCDGVGNDGAAECSQHLIDDITDGQRLRVCRSPTSTAAARQWHRREYRG